MTPVNSQTRYSLYEHFYSFQGEGVHLGRAAYFLRLYGCEQKCSFCDSAGTWHPNWKPKGIPLLEAPQIVELVQENTKEAPSDTFVVLTGGEPTLYDLQSLTMSLANAGYKLHMETAGHHPLPDFVHWITLSPKLFAKPPLRENWQRADEIKLICETPEQMRKDLETVLHYTAAFTTPIWLHPEWSQRENPDLLAAIIQTVKTTARCRAGYQLHKLYRADFQDPNARPDIPLGGIPSGGVQIELNEVISQ